MPATFVIGLREGHPAGGADQPRRPADPAPRYSFTDGIDPVTGELDAGPFFLAYQKDPRRQFVPIQAALSARDALNEYIRQTSSAIFAVPPGVAARGLLGGRPAGLTGSGRTGCLTGWTTGPTTLFARSQARNVGSTGAGEDPETSGRCGRCPTGARRDAS